MKIIKIVSIVFILILICLIIFIIAPYAIKQITRTIDGIKMTNKVDYIEDNGTKTYIKKIKIKDPTIWKGSRDGILHYKDGMTKKIKISFYGDFFAIKDEQSDLFSDGQIYVYEIEE